MNNYIEKLSQIKSRDEKVKYLESIDFPITFKEGAPGVTLTYSNLGLSSSLENLESSLKDLKTQKSDYFKKMVEEELEGEICFPPETAPASFKDVIKVFTGLLFHYKGLIIFLVVVLVAGNSCSSIGKAIKKSNRRMKEKIQQNMDNVSIEKTKKRQARISKFLNFVRPYYVQLKVFEKEVGDEALGHKDNKE
jgi:hypothetical protein